MKLIISTKTGNYYYFDETKNQDFHTKEGFVKLDDILNNKKVISNTNKEFLVLEASDFDKINKFKRGPQLIQAKDLGYVVGRCRLSRKSCVLEAGGGMGVATSFFSSIVDSVTTYEIREEHLKIIRSNLDFMNCDNVELKLGDLNDEIGSYEKEKFDLLFLDMPDVEKVLEKDLKSIKNGGYIVCYVPSITQVLDITKVIEEKHDELYLEETTEIISRQWKCWGKVARPNHRKENDHTAFLVFIRKI